MSKDHAPDETPAERRRRLDAVFGEVLPETTSDERESATDDRSDTSEDWLKAQVPPHHG
jgi:hypothetical protein